MLRVVFALICAIIAAAGLGTDAEAKRKGFVIPLPGLSRGDTVERVVDLPDVPALQRADGSYIDLGYLHKRNGGGKWVGYIGSSTRYLSFSPEQLETLLSAGGMNALPPVPTRSDMAGTIWMVLMGLGVFGLGVLAWRLIGSTGAKSIRLPPPPPKAAAAGAAQGTGKVVNTTGNGEGAKPARSRGSLPPPASGGRGLRPALAAGRVSAGFAGRQCSAGFGRRG